MTREEAIEVYNGLINEKIKAAFEFFAPELCESEDERVRKVIFKLLLGMREEIFTSQDEIVTKEKVLAYLKKQEHKHPEWSEGEMKLLNSIIDDYEKAAKSFCGYDGKIGLLKAIRDGEYNLSKPAERKINEIIDAMNGEHEPGDIYSEDGRLIAKKDESEDERVRKEIIGYLNSRVSTAEETELLYFKRWIAWLEKQKEPENISASTIIPSCWECEQKEPLTPLAEALSNFLKNDFEFFARKEWNEAKWNEVMNTQATELQRLAYLEKQKEQKPEDLPAGFYVTLPDGKKYYTKEMRCNGMNVKVVEPKPAEWGEEDEEIFNNIIEKAKGGHWIEVNEITWLINRFKSLRPQPKPEAEGDNETEIQKAYREGKNAGRKEVFDHPEEYGLQLRRMYDYETGKRTPEWSKEETKDLVHILKVLDDCYVYGKHDLSKTDYDNLTSTIKSLRPSWKPSEEHLSALLAIFNDPDNIGSATCQLALTDLYEHLKKL